jgi:hypothetical protein
MKVAGWAVRTLDRKKPQACGLGRVLPRLDSNQQPSG